MAEIDRCAQCGSDDKRSAPMLLQGTEIPDAYCGACGVNWGRTIKPKPQPIGWSQSSRRANSQASDFAWKRMRWAGGSR